MKERNLRMNLFKPFIYHLATAAVHKNEENLCAPIIRGNLASKSDPDLQLHQVKCDGPALRVFK